MIDYGISGTGYDLEREFGIGTDWSSIASGAVTAAGNWAIAREQRRAAVRGADPAAVQAMQPGNPGSNHSSMVGGTGFLFLGLAVVAALLVFRR